MKAPIVRSLKPVLLIGGADLDENALKSALSRSDTVVAADGGARSVLAQGRVPDAVIGDLDSVRAQDLALVPPDRIHRVEEQDSTDFDKCLRNIDAPLVLAHGFLGRRLDHQMAAFTALARHADRRCILVGQRDVVALAPPRIVLDLAPASRMSLFPLGPVTGRSAGLKWPIDGIAFAPDDIIGTSNEATGPVDLQIDAPAMLLMLPLAALDALVSAMETSPARWPARA